MKKPICDNRYSTKSYFFNYIQTLVRKFIQNYMNFSPLCKLDDYITMLCNFESSKIWLTKTGMFFKKERNIVFTIRAIWNSGFLVRFPKWKIGHRVLEKFWIIRNCYTLHLTIKISPFSKVPNISLDFIECNNLKSIYCQQFMCSSLKSYLGVHI